MRDEIKKGFVACLPVAASVFAYGGVLGVLAHKRGLSALALLVMDVAVFAGSSQFVIVEMLQPPLEVVQLCIAVLAINLRYLLICASCYPVLSDSSLPRRLFCVHFVTDESWALAMAAQRRGEGRPSYLFGAGFCVMCAWTGGTLVGYRLGAFITHPEMFALDFAFVAVFTALAASLWRGRQDVLPWLVAVGCAWCTHELWGGYWHVIGGGLGGAIVAALLGTDGEEEA